MVTVLRARQAVHRLHYIHGCSVSGNKQPCIAMQENLRQLCVFQLASKAGQSYRWWEYVTKFGEECTMAGKKYNSECAEKVCAVYMPSMTS